MQPISHEQDDARDALLLLQDLGAAIRLSLKVTPDEPLPAGMGLLLMRLAMVEALKGAAGQEARGDLEFFQKQWAEACEQFMDSSSRTRRRSCYQSAG